MNAGKTFFDLTLAESVPAGSRYVVEMGDGSGTKSVTHEKVVKSVGDSLPLGDVKNLQTIAKDNFVNAINEIKKKSESGGSSIDDSKIGNLSSLTTTAKDNLVNATNELDKKKINASAVLKTQEQVEANTNPDNVASAVVVGEVINNLGGYSFGETADGKPGYRKPGADTVIPFSSSHKEIVASNQSWIICTNGTTQTKSINVTAIAGYQYLTADDFYVNIKKINGGVTDSYVSLGGKSYNATTGILTLSATTGKDSWFLSGAAPSGRTHNITFDICI